MLKKILKNTIGRTLSAFNYPLIVNSYGRSGSTVLKKSIVNATTNNFNNEIVQDVIKRSVSQKAWNLEKNCLKKGVVYKTHDYPPLEEFKDDVRMLYTFADPIDVVLSLLLLYDNCGEEWMKIHYTHLRVPFRNFPDIVNEDQLKLEYHLDRWLQEERFPIAFVRYENMWNHQDDISEFMGFEIQLPAFRQRKAKLYDDIELKERLEETYQPLREKIASLDDFFVN